MSSKLGKLTVARYADAKPCTEPDCKNIHVIVVCDVPQLADALIASLEGTSWFFHRIRVDVVMTPADALPLIEANLKPPLVLVTGAPCASRDAFKTWIDHAVDMFVDANDSGIEGRIWTPDLSSENWDHELWEGLEDATAEADAVLEKLNVTVEPYPKSVGTWLREQCEEEIPILEFATPPR